MLLIDQKTTPNVPTSYFLTRAEFKEIYPHRLNSRLSYVFYYDQPKEINEGEAKLLLKKYSHLLKWEKKLEIDETNRHQELSKMKYKNLKTVGGKLGMTFKELQGTKEVLIDNIVKKEIEIGE